MENEEHPLLSANEIRVLGCLLEKAATTPDAYPLTLNNLLLACNQKTNREPVVEFDEDIVIEAIDDLRQKGFVFRVDVAGSRVAKYRHNIDELLGLSRGSKALLTVLLLRGPQTLGELRTRCERMHSFADTKSVEEELIEVAEEIDRPLWMKLPRAPGKKEERYQHLFSGEPDIEALEQNTPAPVEAAAIKLAARDERIQSLETEVVQLKEQIESLKNEFDAFKQEFM